MKNFVISCDILYNLLILGCCLVVGQNETESGNLQNPGPSRSENMRRRSRTNRINNIRQHVLSTLGFSAPPQIDENVKQEILRNLSISEIPYRVVTQQCYAGSCTLPNWIDNELWNDEDTKTLRLFFDVLQPESSGTTVLNATLKLHIKERTACQCFRDTEGDIGEDSIRFTVFVSQFLRPLKRRNRIPRMRILDVKMVVVRRDEWITFNVAEAIQEWIERRRRRHGLEVNVIDSQGFPIDAKAVFGVVDCESPADVECQDINLPVVTQQGLNFSTTPVLEVFTETRPHIQFRGKRHSSDQEPFVFQQDESDMGGDAFVRKMRSVGRCGGNSCRTRRTATRKQLHATNQFQERLKHY